MKLSHHSDYKPSPNCGCGSDKALFDYVPDTFWFGSVKFKPACCIHDDRYGRGGAEEDKIFADRELLDNLIKIVDDTSKKWYIPTWLARHQAMNYYDAVMRAGNKSFNFHDTEAINV